MTDKILWKICGVKDLHTGRLCADVGADYIGLHAILAISEERSERFRSIGNDLSVNYPEVKPIVLTKAVELSEIEDLVLRCGAKGVQLQHPMTNEKVRTLALALRRLFGDNFEIFVLVSAEDDDVVDRVRQLSTLAGEIDYVLVDKSWRGGSGLRAPTERLAAAVAAARPVPAFVAGGLDPDNVLEVVASALPVGVDVESRLELPVVGKPKDPEKVLAFARRIRTPEEVDRWRHPRRQLVSVALTDVSIDDLETTVKQLEITDVDFFHVDHSDGSLYAEFLRLPLPAVATLRRLCPCIPYDVHLMTREYEETAQLVKSYLKLNPLLRLVTLHADGREDLISDRFLAQIKSLSELGVEPGISLYASHMSVSLMEELVPIVKGFRIKEVNIVTRTIIGDGAIELDLASRLSEVEGLNICVDRGITIDKLRMFQSGIISHAVVGQFVLQSANFQTRIAEIRRLLSAQV